MQPRYFGTDGIRGTFGEPPLDVPFLRRLGYGLAQYLTVRTPGAHLQIVAGRDPRVSGPEILRAVSEGLLAGGHRVIDLGVVPTPVVPGDMVQRRANFGIMITASHNPPGDNGVKFFDQNGLKLDDATELEIEAWVDRVTPLADTPNLPPLETAEALEAYRRLRSLLLPSHSLAGWVVAIDCGHGATCATTPAVFRLLGADVRARAANPDGATINTDSGSEHPEHLAALVRAAQARLGIAHDGDGDRLVVCDEFGAVVNGDEVLGILALHALRTGALKENLVVATAGGRVVRVPVGDRQVLHKLLELGAELGGENSGHYIFAHLARCGDGLLAALQLVRVLLETGRPLSELRKEIPLYPQRTANLRVREKKPFEELPIFGMALRDANAALDKRGRVLARYSGTEKKLRLLVEGPDAGELDILLGTLKLAAARELGAT